MFALTVLVALPVLSPDRAWNNFILISGGKLTRYGQEMC